MLLVEAGLPLSSITAVVVKSWDVKRAPSGIILGQRDALDDGWGAEGILEFRSSDFVGLGVAVDQEEVVVFELCHEVLLVDVVRGT